MKIIITIEDVGDEVNVTQEQEGETGTRDMTAAEKLANALMHKAADLIGEESVY